VNISSATNPLFSTPITSATSSLLGNTISALLSQLKSVNALDVAPILGKSSSTSSTEPIDSLPAGESLLGARAIDNFNQDGWSVLPWQAIGESAQLWLINETGFETVVELSDLGEANWQLGSVEDFNQDEQLDLLWYNPLTRESQIWLMNGTEPLTSVSLPVAPVGYELQATGYFNDDTSVDLLWRNPQTGKNQLWLLQGTEMTFTEKSVVSLPEVLGVNLNVKATGDFDRDGDLDILWRNEVTGDRLLWSMEGVEVTTTRLMLAESALATEPTTDDAITGDVVIQGGNITQLETASPSESIAEPKPPTQAELFAQLIGTVPTLADLEDNPELLPTLPILDWSIAAIADFDENGTLDVRLRHLKTQETLELEGTTFSQIVEVLDELSINWQVALQPPAETTLPPVKITEPIFSGAEGEAGTFQIRLTEAPATDVTVTLDTGDFLVVDANATGQDGFQNQLFFTTEDWYQPRTLSFIAEKDASSRDRLIGNWISFSLADALTSTPISSVTYDLGTVTNTYTPNPNAFNIDLDFRNDYTGFWNQERQAIAQQAANDWASRIANEWTDFELDATIKRLDSSGERTNRFNSKRYVDDLLIFVNVPTAADTEAALGGADYEFGGWVASPELMPRVGQIFVNPDIYANYPDQTLYQVVSHEIGHVLGLVGLNWRGYNLISRTNPLAATFNGFYATKVYGEPIPLQSQEGGDFSHPAAWVRSIMSYDYLYSLPTATEIDFAMLADSGYRVRGINYNRSI
jgi:hypothetical protein